MASKAFHELSTPAIYIFRPDAKNAMWPQIDGYPHIASDAFVKLPELVIEVQGEGARLSMGCIGPPPVA